MKFQDVEIDYKMWNFAYFKVADIRKFRPLWELIVMDPICIIIKTIYFYDNCKILS